MKKILITVLALGAMFAFANAEMKCAPGKCAVGKCGAAMKSQTKPQKDDENVSNGTGGQGNYFAKR